jgi:rod shape-determining protein MreD
MSKEIKYIILLPLFLFVQIYILNEVMFASYINPYLYLIILFVMPFKTQNWFLLIYAFILGLSVDIFSETLGMHSSACLIIALLKQPITKITIPHNIIEENDELISQKIGVKSFILFTSILVFIHHSILFVLEHASIDFRIILKIILSTIISSIIITICQFFFFRV